MTVRGTVRADPDRARRRERFPSPNFIDKLAGVSPLVLFRASLKTGIEGRVVNDSPGDLPHETHGFAGTPCQSAPRLLLARARPGDDEASAKRRSGRQAASEFISEDDVGHRKAWRGYAPRERFPSLAPCKKPLLSTRQKRFFTMISVP